MLDNVAKLSLSILLDSKDKLLLSGSTFTTCADFSTVQCASMGPLCAWAT